MLYVVDWFFNLDWCVVILDCCIGMVCGMYWTGVMDWCVVHVHVWSGEVQYGHPTSSDIGCIT